MFDENRHFEIGQQAELACPSKAQPQRGRGFGGVPRKHIAGVVGGTDDIGDTG